MEAIAIEVLYNERWIRYEIECPDELQFSIEQTIHSHAEQASEYIKDIIEDYKEKDNA